MWWTAGWAAGSERLVTLGVIADTHVPDRAAQAPRRARENVQHAGVEGIQHPGGVWQQSGLDELAQVAPVHAVFGNRDIFYLPGLPMHLTLTLEGVTVGMAHGHENWKNYFTDKVEIVFRGLRQEPYLQRLRAIFPQAEVIVFGHLHIPVQAQVDGKLFFNPGSACCPFRPRKNPPAVGLLHLGGPERVRSEIIPL